ncbi:MAG: L-threonylcarbamoyladenylate synthase [Anaerolineales bacterium]|jgi:L-threonylcarbamoyladenylate synthase|nr:L-threonylcarbamoyladenylate synthase [Anaerolineales bacterium]
MKTEILKADHPVVFRHAVDILNHGGTVVFPTDTVYGLGALPFNKDYVERLYVIKGRNSTRAIAVLIGDVSELEKVSVSPSKSVKQLAEQYWPGPLTLVVPRHPNLPEVLTSLLTVGVRVPDHPVALSLLGITGPLAVTSANLSGRENTNSAVEAFEQLRGRVDLIIDGGRSPGGVPSTVVDCTTPDLKILRPGPISYDDLDRIVSI